MAWTKEQKKANRAKKRKEESQKQQTMGEKMIQLAPPNHELNKPLPKKDLNNNRKAYGGHQKALNFPMEDIVSLKGPPITMEDNHPAPGSLKIGDLTIGLVYEGDWKAKSKYAGKGERTMCETSEKYLDFLLHVKQMLVPLVDQTLKLWMDESMRVNVLYGANTLAHTDSYRGNTPNFAYIVDNPHGKPGWLCYDKFPRFKVSVVKMNGQYYIPHGYSQASDEVRCIGSDPKDPTKPIYYVFESSAIDSMEPVGNLPYGVVGWKANGDIQVVPEYEGVCLYQKPLTFLTWKWKQVIEEALANPVANKPRKRIVKLDATGKWMEFRAYIYRHWWCGNPMVLRYHAFFRTIREVPTSSNIIRKGSRINFIDAKNSQLELTDGMVRFTTSIAKPAMKDN